MVYPLGIPTVQDIISTSYKLFKLYSEARGRAAKVAAAVRVLESLGSSLDRLEHAITGDDASGNRDIEAQVRTARAAWAQLDTYLQQFRLKQKDEKPSLQSARTVYCDVRWAINVLDGKMSELEGQINICLMAIIPNQLAIMQTSISSLTASIADIKVQTQLGMSANRTDASTEGNGLDSEGIHFGAQTRNAVRAAAVPCWIKKGGCHCRCHSKSLWRPDNSRYVFIETQGWQTAGQRCTVLTCDAHVYNIQIRLAACRIWLPFAITIALRIQTDDWIPKMVLTPNRVCRYTAPGFRKLWKIENKPPLRWDEVPQGSYSTAHDVAMRQKLASFKRLFVSGQASFEDVDPKGEGYLDRVLRRPWPGLREVQWDLVKFLMIGSPETVLSNPRLLYRCATWIGEGPHMDMLASLLCFGLNPEHMDASLFQDWPESSNSGWLAERITPDPMFVEFLRDCLRKQPGFAGCDDLSDTLLTEDDAQFERALRLARTRGGAIRTPPNALGQTAVHLAVLSPKRLRQLLEAGADADCVDNGGSTPLMYAAAYGEAASVLHLIEHGANLWLQDQRNGRYFIDYAVRLRQLHVIRDLVVWLRSSGQAAVALELLDTCMAYHLAQNSSIWDTEITELLFSLGADADIEVGDQTLMHLAKAAKIAQVVMRSGFTAINARTRDGRTPLMNVASLFDPETSARMIVCGKGADVRAHDTSGRNVMHHLLSSVHVSRLYDDQTLDKSWWFALHADMVSCLDLLLRHEASAFDADHCECACSATGCTALIFTLHKITPFRWLAASGQPDCGPVIDLLNSICHQGNQQDLAKCRDAIRRYYDFEAQGMTHTCCRGKMRDTACFPRRLDPAELALAKTQHVEFIAASKAPNNPDDVSDGDVICELANLCFLYEQQSRTRYISAVADRKRKDNEVALEPFVVDYANDVFVIQVNFTPGPSFRSLATNGHNEWLRWCNRNRDKLRMQGGRQIYVDRGLRLLSTLEVAMEGLRPDEDTWYTAPEEAT